MNYFKLFAIAVGLIVAALLALSLFSVVYSALWYLVLFGIVGAVGAVGYKLLVKNKETPKLAAGTPTGIAELENAERALKEYKRKSLSR